MWNFGGERIRQARVLKNNKLAYSNSKNNSIVSRKVKKQAEIWGDSSIGRALEKTELVKFYTANQPENQTVLGSNPSLPTFGGGEIGKHGGKKQKSTVSMSVSQQNKMPIGNRFIEGSTPSPRSKVTDSKPISR